MLTRRRTTGTGLVQSGRLRPASMSMSRNHCRITSGRVGRWSTLPEGTTVSSSAVPSVARRVPSLRQSNGSAKETSAGSDTSPLLPTSLVPRAASATLRSRFPILSTTMPGAVLLRSCQSIGTVSNMTVALTGTPVTENHATRVSTRWMWLGGAWARRCFPAG